MDFTLKKYEELCKVISGSNYKKFNIFDYLEDKEKRNFIILRHDVDKSPKNALNIAKLEKKYGLKSTFYFRMKTFDTNVIRKIYEMEHEIGYHYESLDEASGDYDKAIKIFEENIKKFKEFDVKTICMHGNPLTKWLNKDLWKRFDFRKLGILGEAYLSVDFSNLEYFSDTGRIWSMSYSVKDLPEKDRNKKFIKTTNELIDLIKEGRDNLYILTHPCRWNNNIFYWLKELILQNIKNFIKIFLKRGISWKYQKK